MVAPLEKPALKSSNAWTWGSVGGGGGGKKGNGGGDNTSGGGGEGRSGAGGVGKSPGGGGGISSLTRPGSPLCCDCTSGWPELGAIPFGTL